jgi:RecB family exonuclease
MRTRNLYDPNKPFRLSRARLEAFLNCPRCFYIDRRCGLSEPSGPPFTLNNAVDSLLKKEFDHYRALQKPHPLMTANKIDAVPFQHPDIDRWRDALRAGVTYAYPGTNLTITGGVDDVWVRPSGELIVVDYKATAKEGQVSLDAEWQISYHRQAAVYAWLFERNGFRVDPTAYFVYCNARLAAPEFASHLDFDITVLPCKWDASWIDSTVRAAWECLRSDVMPPSGQKLGEPCEMCAYVEGRAALNR